MMELIEKITINADKRYSKRTQCKCQYSVCSFSCEKCLEYCHFPQKAETQGYEKRNYNCKNMIDFYVCKYSYKYATEIFYALQNIIKKNPNDKINIISCGCGPCTDLMAIDSIKQRKIFNISKITYIGIEITQNIWSNIYSDIHQTFEKDNIISKDISSITNFDQFFQNDYLNIICINYAKK